MKMMRERGERKDNLKKYRKDDNRNKTMEDKTQRLTGVTANTRDGVQNQKQKGRKRIRTGESLVDRRMLVVASLVWCMTKPSQDVCPWDAATVKTRRATTW